MMHLKILLPTRVFTDEMVARIVADDINGSFGILPHHIDFVTALVPGILSYQDENEEEQFVAIGSGILVKRSSEVLLSTRHAVASTDLNKLREMVDEQFRVLDEGERKARSALARLEARFVRRFLDLQDDRL